MKLFLSCKFLGLVTKLSMLLLSLCDPVIPLLPSKYHSSFCLGFRLAGFWPILLMLFHALLWNKVFLCSPTPNPQHPEYKYYRPLSPHPPASHLFKRHLKWWEPVGYKYRFSSSFSKDWDRSFASEGRSRLAWATARNGLKQKTRTKSHSKGNKTPSVSHILAVVHKIWQYFKSFWNGS